MVTLDSLEPDESGVVDAVKATGEIRRRLLDMGLIKGVGFTVVRVAPLGDPIEILLKGFHLTLRKEEARQIWVKKCESGKDEKDKEERPKKSRSFGFFRKKGGTNEEE